MRRATARRGGGRYSSPGESSRAPVGSTRPAVVAAAVQKKHPGAVLIKLYKIETAKGAITYEAEIKTGNKKQELIMNADGSVIK